MKKQAKRRGRPPKSEAVKSRHARFETNGKKAPPRTDIRVDPKDWDGVGRAFPDWF